MIPQPTSIMTDAMNLPRSVCGGSSPYPADAMFTLADRCRNGNYSGQNNLYLSSGYDGTTIFGLPLTR
jgi:hypothetical protein